MYMRVGFNLDSPFHEYFYMFLPYKNDNIYINVRLLTADLSSAALYYNPSLF